MTDTPAFGNEDRISYRRRWRLVVMSLVVWILNNVVNATPDVAQALNLGSTREFDFVVLIGFWLAVLSLVWMVAGVNVRRNPVLNDELTKAHRASAIQLGYWASWGSWRSPLPGLTPGGTCLNRQASNTC